MRRTDRLNFSLIRERCAESDSVTKPFNPSATSLDGTALKTKQRALRDGFDPALGLRIHRAISWLQRAESAGDDADVRFILLWIGFNAAYAREIGPDNDNERDLFGTYCAQLVSFDAKHRIYNAIWERFPHEIRVLLNNRYVFAPFWSFQNGAAQAADWETRLARSRQIIASAMGRRDTATILSIVFDRLYVLRNQLVHGGATWNSSVNRQQVHDGAAVLGWLLPVFIDIMMDRADSDWGTPYYPVVN